MGGCKVQRLRDCGVVRGMGGWEDGKMAGWRLGPRARTVGKRMV